MRERSTIDVVVILLSSMVGLTVLTAALGLIIGKIIHPSIDATRGAEIIANTLTTIVGALVGFIGGRATGRLEANGK